MKAFVLSSLIALVSVLPLHAQPEWKWLVSKADGSPADITPVGLDSGDRPWPAYHGKHQVVQGLGRFFLAGKSSHDGIVWADCGFEPTHAAGDRVFRIVSTQNEYGTVADMIMPYSWYTTTVQVSVDGLTATTADVKMPTPRAVAYGGGTYVIVGQDGLISTSPDALTWTAVTSNTTKTLWDVTYAFHRFIAIGDGGTIVSSSDGSTWTLESTPTLAGFDLRQIGADDSRVVIAANPTIATATEPGTVTLTGDIPVAVLWRPRTNLESDPVLVSASLLRFGGQWYAGRYFSQYYRSYPQFLSSTDAASWTELPVTSTAQYYSYLPPALAGNAQTALFLALRGDDQTYSERPPTAPPVEYVLLRATAGADAAPTITHQPVNVTAARGETTSFSCGATGTGPLSYQWFHEDAVIAGATGPVLTIRLTDNADAGHYSVRIANALGSATTEAATLTVTPAVPLTVTEQPAGATLYADTNLTLHVAVTGSGPITYQWRRNGVAIAETSPTLRLYGYAYSLDSTVGTYDVVVTAPHSSVVTNPAVVARGGPKVTITPSGIISVAAGSSVTVTATATGDGPLTFHWTRTVGGLDVTSSVLTLENVTGADSSPYRVQVTDVNGHSDEASFIISVSVPDPVIETQPISQTVVAGGRVVLHVGLSSTAGYWLQWRHNGEPIPGATTADLTIGTFGPADEGQYDVVIIGGSAYKFSAVATLTLSRSRLVNLSARAIPGEGEDTFVQGFVLRGDASTEAPDVLIRGVGPGLSALGITNAFANPSLRVVDRQAAVVAENDDWGTVLTTGRGRGATAEDMIRFGAFPLRVGSTDSALLVHNPLPGVCTALVSAPAGNQGVVLNEVYGPVTGSQRLVNLSARARVSAGEGVLVAGFVITGNAPLRLLMRGVGPTLASQGIAHPLANPKITLFNRQGQEIHNNDNWSDAANAADIPAAATAAGAFALPAGSNDAVMLETLEPGIYTAHVTPADGTSTGVALVEIYEVP